MQFGYQPMNINLLLAFFIDRVLGDPSTKYHPIGLIGRLINLLEKSFYKIKYKLIGGILLVVISTLIVFFITLFLNWLKEYTYLPANINLISIILIYFILCNKTMVKEAKSVYDALHQNDLNNARRLVGRIVGRDTEILDEAGIIRATIETLAENIVDGFTAPIFYLITGGIPTAYVYKTINTLDSMVGYKNKKYLKFGKPSARLDDIFNYIPARLNIIFLFIATGFNIKVLKFIKQYSGLHPSPNSGISEAGFSAILGIALVGPSYYGGKLHEKKWIGKNSIPDQELKNPDLILKAIKLYWKVIYTTLFFALITTTVFRLPIIFK